MKQTEIFSRELMLSNIDEFVGLYDTRPIKDNTGGMKTPHMFPAWLVIKTLKPKFIIESGVWKGQGTWFFERASPSSKIISIDPNPGIRQYTSATVDYRTRDFMMQSWGDIDPDETLVFLDDHQNSLDRIKFAVDKGFRKLMIEDNYPYLQGDCYTPKKIISQREYVIDKDGSKVWHPPVLQDYQYLADHVKAYQEFPPLFMEPVDPTTRWGDHWDARYQTNQPLLTDPTKYPTAWAEHKDYTWICYLEL